jgi:hypothetical protein
MPLNDISTEQTKATEKMQAATNQMLDYLAAPQTPQSDITPPKWYCTYTATPLTFRSPTHGAVSEVCFS